MRKPVFFILMVSFCFGIGAEVTAQSCCCPKQRTRRSFVSRLFRQPSYSQPRSVPYYYPSAEEIAGPNTFVPAPAAATTNATEAVEAESSGALPTVTADAPAEESPAATTSGESSPSDADGGVRPADDLTVPPTSDPAPADAPDSAKANSKDDAKWRTLFDGKELGDWKVTRFGGEGLVEIEDGQIKCDFGQYLTGVTYEGKELPTTNYEVELEAMREDGGDFFCGLTFPIDKSHASFICGGWGGSVTGISSIDDMDASENSTTGYQVFKNKKWYKIRVRVTPKRLQAWIDDEIMVDEELYGQKFSTRIEVDRCKPLGICCFDTQASYRNIRMREVDGPAEDDTSSDE